MASQGTNTAEESPVSPPKKSTTLKQRALTSSMKQQEYKSELSRLLAEERQRVEEQGPVASDTIAPPQITPTWITSTRVIPARASPASIARAPVATAAGPSRSFSTSSIPMPLKPDEGSLSAFMAAHSNDASYMPRSARQRALTHVSDKDFLGNAPYFIDVAAAYDKEQALATSSNAYEDGNENEEDIDDIASSDSSRGAVYGIEDNSVEGQLRGMLGIRVVSGHEMTLTWLTDQAAAESNSRSNGTCRPPIGPITPLRLPQRPLQTTPTPPGKPRTPPAPTLERPTPTTPPGRQFVPTEEIVSPGGSVTWTPSILSTPRKSVRSKNCNNYGSAGRFMSDSPPKLGSYTPGSARVPGSTSLNSFGGSLRARAAIRPATHARASILDSSVFDAPASVHNSDVVDAKPEVKTGDARMESASVANARIEETRQDEGDKLFI